MDYVFWTIALIVLVATTVCSPQFEAWLAEKSKRMEKLMKKAEADQVRLEKVVANMELMKARLVKLGARKRGGQDEKL